MLEMGWPRDTYLSMACWKREFLLRIGETDRCGQNWLVGSAAYAVTGDSGTVCIVTVAFSLLGSAFGIFTMGFGATLLCSASCGRTSREASDLTWLCTAGESMNGD